MAKFFNSQLLDLRDEVRKAMGAGRYRHPQTKKTREWLLDFSRGSTIHLTHSLSDNARVFGGSESWRSFHRDLAASVAAGHIKGVRRIFILDAIDEQSNPTLLEQIRLHEATQGYSYRLLLRRQFEELKTHANLALGPSDEDFGIYNKYVFQWSLDRDTHEHCGFFVFDPKRVKAYSTLYEDCWDSGWSSLSEMNKALVS